MTQPNEATLKQIQAADPKSSTWLSANAGSGKTRVLTDRVARLLLDGVLPQNILCLTYTKAAASEMQNRLFKRLGEWAMLEDRKLAAELIELGGRDAISAQKLRDARTLFARAIETPGGLKIQTIHSFCAALLRRFPLEAGVSPTFTEMDERTAKILQAEIVEEMADGQSMSVIDRIAAFYTGDDFGALTQEVARNQEMFSKVLGRDEIWSLAGLPVDFSEPDIPALAFDGSEAALFADLLPLLAQQSASYVTLGKELSQIDLVDRSINDLRLLFSRFLYSGDKARWTSKSSNFPPANHKNVVAALAPVIEDLHAFMDRIAEAKDHELRLCSARKNLALHDFARVFLPLYAERKMRHGWLDFDDLILKARGLLTDAAVAQWVLYRLDGGIDHILVDEAQDTSPAQWDVIRLLAQEFTSGQGARENAERTIFVVGDKKQSIYSFQGADPRSFDRMAAYFDERLKDAGLRLQSLSLDYSFRSAQPILSLVDQTFSARDGRGVGEGFKHIAFKAALPGRVDVWPLIEKADEKDTRDWFDPVDHVSDHHHSAKLAARIAHEIKRMIDEKVTIPAEIDDEKGARTIGARVVSPGDVLILVQRRSDLFHEIIRACKRLELPIAGADRMRVGAEMAVKDLAALMRFLATPEDSLSLATVLRSPLFGWTENALFDLAHKREEKYLWTALRNREAEFHDTCSVLKELRNSADYLRPYDLIERVLTRYDGRKKLLARLGTEAEDGIDALLTQSLTYEQVEVPSLTGFVTWMDSDEMDIKRQMDNASDQIRVMTVHGAKGLEAPIVILPETANRAMKVRDEIYKIDGTAVWKTPKTDSPRHINEAREALKSAQADENMRLLYVAMTRAEKWLIVCSAGDLGNTGESWYDIVSEGMSHAGAVAFEFRFGTGLRLESGDWTILPTEEKNIREKETVPLPQWAIEPAPALIPQPKPLAPSSLGGAKAISGDGYDEDTALRRGRQLHRLLEYLPAFPEARWSDIARDVLATGEDISDPTEAAALLGEARNVLLSPELRPVFSPDALTEVDVTASLPALDGTRILGAIDRLLVEETRVLAVDFKSNRMVPSRVEDTPAGILAQMGAYAAALEQIFPGKTVETAILWTSTATLMRLPNDMVSAALRSATRP